MVSSAILPFAAGLCAAAAYDVRTRRIPNLLCAAILLFGLGARLHLGGVGSGLLGAAAGLALLLVPFALGLLGGGDVKLLAAIGAWLGIEAIVPAALAGLALGGLMSAVMALANPALRREVGASLLLAAATRRAPPASAAKVPMGLALAAGALAVAVVLGGLPHA